MTGMSKYPTFIVSPTLVGHVQLIVGVGVAKLNPEFISDVLEMREQFYVRDECFSDVRSCLYGRIILVEKTEPVMHKSYNRQSAYMEKTFHDFWHIALNVSKVTMNNGNFYYVPLLA
jgi:hypothetical protein